MKLTDLKNNWEGLGRADPMWAILADPNRHGHRWTPEEFFATGEEHVQGYLDKVREAGLSPGHRRALDFGCGAGRLTQALAAHFDQTVGVDIADSMIALARAQNASRGRRPSAVSFVGNAAPDLSLFDDDSFDFVLSIVVLQHMDNDLKRGYLREFVRVLKPGGVAVFTVPSHADWSPKGLIRRLPNRVLNVVRRRRYGYQSVMEFYPMHRQVLEYLVAQTGAQVVSAEAEPMAGPPWTSFLYVVAKPAPDQPVG